MNIDLNRFKAAAAPDDPAQASAWASWLSDDPAPGAAQAPRPAPARPRPSVALDSFAPAAPRPQTQPTPVQNPDSAPAAKTTNVNINISLPQLKKPKLPDWPYKKILIIAAAAVVIFALGLAIKTGIQTYLRSHKAQEAASALQAAPVAAKKLNPSFKPLVPAGAQPQTAAYDGAKDSYSYQDQIKGMQLMVSQQTLPAKFSASPAQLAAFAKSLQAQAAVSVSDGTAYLATDAKTGGQTVVMASRGVLLFAQSPFKHSDSEWASYLNGLAVLN